VSEKENISHPEVAHKCRDVAWNVSTGFLFIVIVWLINRI